LHIIIATSSISFILIALDVWFDGLLVWLDRLIYTASLSWHTPIGDSIFFAITKLGNLSSIFLLSIAITTILIWQKDRLSIFLYWIGILGSIALFGSIKELFARGRPSNYIGDIVELGYSFPSGHATMSISFSLLVFYIFYDRVSDIYKSRLIIFSILFTLSITFSRLYLGLHYLSDLLAGLALGLCWVSIVFWINLKRVKYENN